VFEMIRSLGAYTVVQVGFLGRLGLFLGRMLAGITKPPGKFLSVVKQIQFIGTRSFVVIGFTAIFTGMVLALQDITPWPAWDRRGGSARRSL